MSDKTISSLNNYIEILEGQLLHANIMADDWYECCEEANNNYVGVVGLTVDFLMERDLIPDFIAYASNRYNEEDYEELLDDIKFSMEIRKEELERNKNNEIQEA